MKYWPGTKIKKSTGNAFDWRNNISQIASSREFKQSQASSLQMAGKSQNFSIYTKAKAAK